MSRVTNQKKQTKKLLILLVFDINTDTNTLIWALMNIAEQRSKNHHSFNSNYFFKRQGRTRLQFIKYYKWK